MKPSCQEGCGHGVETHGPLYSSTENPAMPNQVKLNADLGIDSPDDWYWEMIEEERHAGIEWWQIYPTVTAVGKYLLDDGYTAAELQFFYEYPWLFTDEYVEMTNI